LYAGTLSLELVVCCVIGTKKKAGIFFKKNAEFKKKKLK
jgi:hypothetical protein